MGTNRWWVVAAFAAVIAIAVLSVLLAMSNATIAEKESDLSVLRSDNNLQSKTIAMQSLDFQRFNQAALETNRLNSLIAAGAEKTVIEYREILRREKTCNLPVPAHISLGLLRNAYRLRASAMHTDASGVAEVDDSAITASGLTYCQAVLWIEPLLAEIEKGNNQLSRIESIERQRQAHSSDAPQ